MKQLLLALGLLLTTNCNQVCNPNDQEMFDLVYKVASIDHNCTNIKVEKELVLRDRAACYPYSYVLNVCGKLRSYRFINYKIGYVDTTGGTLSSNLDK